MNWIHHYQLFLFDFDGLLVDTERLHYLAYKTMCKNRGIDFKWSFEKYCKAAHYDATLFQKRLYEEFPELKLQDPTWKILYGEKQQILGKLLKEGAGKLMPGVSKLLEALEQAKIKICVVTNSPDQLVDILKEQHSVLNGIPFWMTRKDYQKPKPDPECYQKAVQMFANLQDQIIGFEDTPRGMQALFGISAKRVLVCETNYPEIGFFKEKGVLHFRSFEELNRSDIPL